MRTQIRPAVVLLIVLTILTGIIYPLIVTGIAKVAFADEAGGSVIMRDGKAIGSELIAQPFTDAKYFWPRPSACSYSGTGGSGSNLGPTNPALAEAIKARVATLKAADPGNDQPVPVDLVTASGSGLDPHISVAAARYQMGRVARARKVPLDQVEDLLAWHIEPRTLGVLGEERVNVLQLNLELDHPQPSVATTPPPAQESGITVYRNRGFLPGH